MIHVLLIRIKQKESIHGTLNYKLHEFAGAKSLNTCE